MQLQDIFILALLLFFLRLIPSIRIKHIAVMISSVICIFTFQPILPIRGLDFTLPTMTILLTICVYGAFSKQNPITTKNNLIDAAIILVSIILISATRFISYDGILTASRPPQPVRILPGLLGGTGLALLINYLIQKEKKWPVHFCIYFIIMILVILKTPQITLLFSRMARSLNGQSSDMALPADIRWFGFSYIAFRLLSILIDSSKGRKTDIGLSEFFVYVCFPPALSAGPIDRWDRFCKEYRIESKNTITEDLYSGLGQITLGLFHKFILADALAKMAVSSQNAGQFIHKGWAWAALFSYALQIYFDFCGYSEIAVGLGMLFGIHLPKNFDHPYLKPDLTRFWSSWHITLTQWIRSYVFNPLTRSLRSNKSRPMPKWLIILITQLTTMLLIGLWHGVTVNFVIWGLWHGIGLFVHQFYSQKTGAWLRSTHICFQKIYTVCSTLLTIIYVSLGWVWFVIPDFGDALKFFGRLFI